MKFFPILRFVFIINSYSFEKSLDNGEFFFNGIALGLLKFGISTLIWSQYGKDVKKVYDEAIIGKKNMADVFTVICDSKGLNRDVKEMCEFYKEEYKKNKILYKDVMEFIKSLRNKFRLICLTDTNHIHFETHKEEGIMDLFDESFGSHQIGMNKGNREAFMVLLNNLKIKPEEIIFIDDNSKNIDNAKSLGIMAIQFKNSCQLTNEMGKFL